MSSLFNDQAIQDLVVLAMFAVGIIVAYKISKSSKLPSQTIKNLEESNKSLIGLNTTREVEIKKLSEEVHANNAVHTEEVLRLNKEISELMGQIKVYKELPLQQLAEGIEKVAATNTLILETLKGSAAIAATTVNDGGLLVKTKESTPVTVKMEKK